MFHVPEQYRNTTHNHFGTTNLDGNNGLFVIPNGSDIFQCIVSDGIGWEHVSVTVRTKNRQVYNTPKWEDMCYMKEIFWDDEDVVMQLHPKKSEYVNNHPCVLHLWRPTEKEIPTPPMLAVGVK